jgi:hypothetical protein
LLKNPVVFGTSFQVQGMSGLISRHIAGIVRRVLSLDLFQAGTSPAEENECSDPRRFRQPRVL